MPNLDVLALLHSFFGKEKEEEEEEEEEEEGKERANSKVKVKVNSTQLNSSERGNRQEKQGKTRTRIANCT